MTSRFSAWLKRFVALLALTTLLPLAAPVAAQTPDTGDPLQVVASFSVLGDLVRDVGGDAVAITTLIGPGVDAHTFDPAPADLVTLESADVVFEIGLGFEPWLDGFFESTEPQGVRVVVTEGIEPRRADEEHEGDADEGEEHQGEEHEHGEFDPHVWHNVGNAMIIVANIRDALVAADPANAATYEANAEATLADLETLDASVREQVSMVPEDRRKLVTSHDTFGYFADAYGFTVLGTALGSLSTEVGDPSARDIATLVTEIEDAGVPAIFAENVSNPDLMEAIAVEAGVVLAPPLYSDALGAPGTAGETYEGMIRSNVTTIVDALNP